MFNQPEHRLSEKGINVWRISGMLSSLFPLIISAAVITFTILFDWYILFSIFSVVFFIIWFYFFVGLLPTLKWKRWRYEVREDEIEIQHGVFVVKRTLVPMVRVQHVDTKQGPVLRKYDLAVVSISTAATVHEIPVLGTDVAEELRNYISKKARVAEEDV
ncbi:PH domain-containing protein [Niallia sp. 01092]|uniref:PH domain-containing protein n=1 Tax=unclassified Niallia TaxID=2837522 RepID=UPI003FD663C0